MLELRARAVARIVAICAVAAVIPTSPALAAPKQRLGSRTLRQGMRGSDVRTLQADLTKAGFKTSGDGIFGPVTAHSAKLFERRYHLKLDGIVNAAFLRELRLVLEELHKVIPDYEIAPGFEPEVEWPSGTLQLTALPLVFPVAETGRSDA